MSTTNKTLTEYVHACHEISREHGFWDFWDDAASTLDPEAMSAIVAQKLMLIVSECAEALEGERNRIPVNQKGSLGEELADICIRAFDCAGGWGIPLEELIERKVAYNRTRPPMHGKAF